MPTYTFPASTDTTSNQFAPNDVAAVAAAMVAEDAYLSALVSRNLEQDLLGGGGRGRTVNVRIPAALVARDRQINDKKSGIVVDELLEQTTSITLGTHAYSAVTLSEEDLHYKIDDFAARVLAPQTEAVADFVENAVVDALLSEPVNTDVRWDAANPTPTFTAIRKILRQRGVPQTNLNLVVGTDVYAALLDAKAIEDASQSGSTAALRDSNVGRIRGFQVVESTRIPDGDIIAFHRDAFTLAVRAPLVPQGAAFGATATGRGFPLRWLRDYDPRITSDLSVVSTFVGVAKMPLYKVERTYGTTPSVDVVQVPDGAAFRMSISDAEPV